MNERETKKLTSTSLFIPRKKNQKPHVKGQLFGFFLKEIFAASGLEHKWLERLIIWSLMGLDKPTFIFIPNLLRGRKGII